MLNRIWFEEGTGIRVCQESYVNYSIHNLAPLFWVTMILDKGLNPRIIVEKRN